MSFKLSLRLLTVFILACSFGGQVGCAEDRKPAADQSVSEKIQLHIIGEQAAGGGIVYQLGETPGLWLGLALDLDDGRIKVNQVLPESPAAKAGIKANDVILASGKTDLKKAAELQQLVQSSNGKPLSLKILRDDKEIVIEVKPARRGVSKTIVIGEGNATGDGDQENVRKQLELLLKQTRNQAAPAHKADNNWQLLRMPQIANNTVLPENLEITIKKKGNQPLRIKVRQDVQTWRVTEKELDKLPASIRVHVARMLPSRAPTTMWIPSTTSPGASRNTVPQTPRWNPVPANPRTNPRATPAPINPRTNPRANPAPADPRSKPRNPAPANPPENPAPTNPRTSAKPAATNSNTRRLLVPSLPLIGSTVPRPQLKTNIADLKKVEVKQTELNNVELRKMESKNLQQQNKLQQLQQQLLELRKQVEDARKK